MRLKVNEIFYSIQGESLHAGLCCVFVRLTGCNLRCAYCDTRYAYEDGAMMDAEEIISRIRKFKCNLVEITGGEPLVQEHAPALITLLLDAGYSVLLETNGSVDAGHVDPRCIKILDVKCPGSGESDKNDFNNLKYLSPQDQLKFVITNREDYDFAKHVMNSSWPSGPPVEILLSPAQPVMDPATLAGWMLEDRLRARLQLQLHKILWPHAQRGK